MLLPYIILVLVLSYNIKLLSIYIHINSLPLCFLKLYSFFIKFKIHEVILLTLFIREWFKSRCKARHVDTNWGNLSEDCSKIIIHHAGLFMRGLIWELCILTPEPLCSLHPAVFIIYHHSDQFLVGWSYQHSGLMVRCHPQGWESSLVIGVFTLFIPSILAVIHWSLPQLNTHGTAGGGVEVIPKYKLNFENQYVVLLGSQWLLSCNP